MPETFAEKRRRYNRDWIANNREQYNASKLKYRTKVKHAAMSAYSNGKMSCAECNFKNINGLTLDHINDDGAAHRKELLGPGRRSGLSFYEKLKTLGYPPGLQVLCANCNLIKEVKRRRGN